MNPRPSPEQVLGELGDKVLEALVEAVDGARDDLESFREWRPGWFSTFSSRFTANFLHERMWAGLVRRIDPLDHVTVLDREPHRQLHADGYVLRVKRHHPGDRISTYPTEGALRFWSSEMSLPGMEEVSLALGYMWDAELRKVGDAVISFRDALDKPVWAVRIQGEPGDVAGIRWAPVDPNLPEFDLSHVVLDSVAGRGDGAESS